MCACRVPRGLVPCALGHFGFNRGQSIFWRVLRPELVKTNVIPEHRKSSLLREIRERCATVFFRVLIPHQSACG